VQPDPRPRRDREPTTPFALPGRGPGRRGGPDDAPAGNGRHDAAGPHAGPATGDGPLGAYDELLELTVRQLAAVDAGDLDDLDDLAGRWEAIVRALPDVAPAAARSTLERTAALHDELGRRLAASRRALDDDRGHVGAGRRMARGYGGAPAGAARMDRTA